MPWTQLRFALLAAYTLDWASHGSIPLDNSRSGVGYEKVLQDGYHWVDEQMPGGNAGIENGTLEIDDAK